MFRLTYSEIKRSRQWVCLSLQTCFLFFLRVDIVGSSSIWSSSSNFNYMYISILYVCIYNLYIYMTYYIISYSVDKLCKPTIAWKQRILRWKSLCEVLGQRGLPKKNASRCSLWRGEKIAIGNRWLQRQTCGIELINHGLLKNVSAAIVNKPCLILSQMDGIDSIDHGKMHSSRLFY